MPAASTMNSLEPLRRFAARHAGWLVWLALLLPLAQAAARLHVHQHDEASSALKGKQAAVAAACELCVVAAAAGGAPLPSVEAPWLPAATPVAAPAIRAVALRVAARPAAPYLSRAPPSVRT